MSKPKKSNFKDRLSRITGTVMENHGFKASLMQAERLSDIGSPNMLPPGTPVKVFHVDALPGCPKSWVGGQGSYVCPIDKNKGLWFDWTMNDSMNTGVVASVKGMNPITGQKMESLALEQYDKECPKCKVEFKGARFCPRCEYKWPPQNYVANPNVLWWDGFRQTDGTVRQFFFSEEESRDIASLVIGKENTVPAFGFAFYEPVDRRKTPELERGRGGSGIMNFGVTYYYPQMGSYLAPKTTYSWPYSSFTKGANNIIYGSPGVTGSTGSIGPTGAPGPTGYDEVLTSGGILNSIPGDVVCRTLNQQTCSLSSNGTRSAITHEARKMDVSIGGGAEILQDLIPDTLQINQWKPKPSAIIRLYFVFVEEFEDIVNNGGIMDLQGDKTGFMKGLPVG